MTRIYRNTCRQCGNFYTGYGALFCSNHCRVTWTNLHRNVAKRSDVRAKIAASRKGKPTTSGVACSPEKREKISASLIGKPTGRRPSDKSIAAFTAAGRKNLRHESGAAHPNWKGGLTPIRQIDYGSEQYKNFVKSCLQRDNYTCKKCGAQNGEGFKIRLQVHHKISYGERPDLRYTVDNGITLCFWCHKSAHRGKKRPAVVDFVPKKKICVNCGREFAIKNPKKYCPECRAKICCPVCGSTTCGHWQRKKLNQPRLF